MMFLLIAAVLCLHVAFAAGPLSFSKSYALVVGVDSYAAPGLPRLSYATRDAIGIAALLKQQGFEVITLLDRQATRTAIMSAMQDDLARRLTAQDRVLVFFAGHGSTETLGGEDRGYIIPYDGTNSNSTWISMDELRTASSFMGSARHQLFIIDACYGGLLTTRSSMVVSAEIPNYLQEISSRKARDVLSAGGKGQQVVDNGSNGHSVFANAIFEAIRDRLADYNKDGYVTFSELVSYVTQAASNPYQTPSSATMPGHQGGEFIFDLAKIAPAQQLTTSAAGQTQRPIFRDSPVSQETVPGMAPANSVAKNRIAPLGDYSAIQNTLRLLTAPPQSLEEYLDARGIRVNHSGMRVSDRLRGIKGEIKAGTTRIYGDVNLPNNYPLPEATAVVEIATINPVTNIAEVDKATLSAPNRSGAFSISCPSGVYEVVFYLKGFRISRFTNVKVTTSGPTLLKTTLSAGSLGEQIDIDYRNTAAQDAIQSIGR